MVLVVFYNVSYFIYIIFYSSHFTDLVGYIYVVEIGRFTVMKIFIDYSDFIEC